MDTAAPATPSRWRSDPGFLAALAIGLALIGLGLSVNIPQASQGFKGDEATYYSLTWSLALDRDFEYRREDLVRVWEEYSGPQGIFLKRGRTIEGLRFTGRLPFVEFVKGADPDTSRLYYGKAYIYPLAAAAFVRVFGTNGFLVLHAILFALNFAAAYALLVARGTARGAAVAFALVYFAASVVPVYFIWLTPELFNVSLVMYAAFFWAYKEAAARSAPSGGRIDRFLRSRNSDLAAAVLAGVATFSKPPHVTLILAIAGLAVLRRQWWQGIRIGAVFGAVTAGLFALNLALTGDLNYQGGDRKTFYGPPPAQSTYAGPAGFPFQTPEATFEVTGEGRKTDELPVEVLVSGDTFRVFRHNVWYFLVGRYSGLVPYFFPGVASAALFFFAPGHRRLWQWLALAVIAATAVGLLLYMPYTYSGGGGPIGNRYYIGFYPLFLLLTPPLAGSGATVVAAALGALFTAKLLFNPFVSSRDPGDAAKTGPLRVLPIELTTINDLPIAAHANRSRLPLGGDPAVRGYFPDDNVFDLEGDRFWVRGKSRADVILRGPARPMPDGRAVPLHIAYLDVEVSNGGMANRVTLSAGRGRQVLDLQPFETRRARVETPYGVPYKPWTFPTNYTYVLSITTSDGFVPYLVNRASTDARFLGAMIRLTPAYRDHQ
jgi:hypothetical protein